MPTDGSSKVIEVLILDGAVTLSGVVNAPTEHVVGGRREGLRGPKRLERCPEVDELVLVLKRMLLPLAMVAIAGLMLVKRAIAQEEDSCEYDLAVRLNREDALCLR